MKKYNILSPGKLGLSWLLGLALILSNCSPEEPDVSNQGLLNVITVMNGIEQGGKFSTTYQAMADLNLTAIYNGSGQNFEYTIFAPNNAAWEAFFNQYEVYDGLGDIPDNILRDILTYHVVPGTVTSANLGNSQTTEQGQAISISGTTLTSTTGNTANVVTADIAAYNGVLHEVNAVLVPSTAPSANIAEIAIGNPDFSSLVAAVSRFPDLLDGIDGASGVFTVFAPTNAAFANALSALGYASLADVPDPLLRTILEYHVIVGQRLSGTLTSAVGTLGGESLQLDFNVVTTADVLATNGVVHIVNEVLVPPSIGTLVGDVLTNPDFSILAEAIVTADLVPALAADGPFTVFAPNDAAFTAAGITDLSAISVDDLTNILTYHVVSGALASGDLTDSYPETLQGQNLMVEVGGGVTVDGVAVSTPDLNASNGIIHVIDNVLMPTDSDIPAVAIAQAPEFTTLVAALQKAGLVETLQGDGPFTVFAPTNAAFDALFTELGITGLDDLTAEQLEPILLYHVLSGKVFSTDLPNGEVRSVSESALFLDASTAELTTSSGQEVDLTATGMLNVRASNGVIHVVNTVLVPESGTE